MNLDEAHNTQSTSHLRPDTKAWWFSVHQDHDLEGHHSRLLTLAAEAWDRRQEARSLLAKDGIVIGGREAAALRADMLRVDIDVC